MDGVKTAFKEDKVTIKEEKSTVEDMVTVYITEQDIKMENTELQGNYLVLKSLKL